MPRKPVDSPSDPLASLTDLPLKTVPLATVHPHPRNPEIDAGYVAVALQRWQDVTGQTPQLLA